VFNLIARGFFALLDLVEKLFGESPTEERQKIRDWSKAKWNPEPLVTVDWGEEYGVFRTGRTGHPKRDAED